MSHVDIETLLTTWLDLPGAPLALVASPSGTLRVLCRGLRPGTLLLLSFAPRLPDATPRRPDAMLQLQGEEPAWLLHHPWRERPLVVAHDGGAAVLLASDGHDPLWRVVLEGPLGAPPVRTDAGWAFVEPPGLLNLIDLDGHDRWQLPLGAPLSASPVLLPASGLLAAGAGADLLVVDLEGRQRLALHLPTTLRALAASPRHALAAVDGEALWLWPRALTDAPLRVRIGPTLGAPVFTPRGAAFLRQPDAGLLHVDPDRQRVLAWAEGLHIRHLHLDHGGAVIAVAAIPETGAGVLLAWPPTPPGALHPCSATPHPLPAEPACVAVEPHRVLVLGAAGELAECRALT